MSRELMGVSVSNLIMIGGVAAVAIAGAVLTSQSTAQDENSFVNQLAASSRAYVSADPDGTNATSANLIQAKKVPPSRIDTAGTGITGKWGGALALAPNAALGGMAANDGFTITETVPTSECESLAKMQAQVASVMSIAGTVVKSFGGTLVTSGASGVTTACASAPTVSMTFGYTAK